MKVWLVPIQPLEERYTQQWWSLFPDELNRQNIHLEVIKSEGLIDNVSCGTFCDINSTLFWNAEQIKSIAKLFHRGIIQDGDVLFLADCEMFGLEGAIKYLATLNNVKVKICGFAHAGSYTQGDFVQQCSPFANHYETAWAHIFDKIFVGSEYHKQQLRRTRFQGMETDWVYVTGNPYDLDWVRQQGFDKIEKKNRVICTNRPDPEKRPDLTLQVLASLKIAHPNWEFMATTSRKEWGSSYAPALREVALDMQRQGMLTIREGLSKIEYLTLLAESKVMTGNTVDEMFGYCLLESLMVDTIPIVEKNFSHPELLEGDERCLFMNLRHQALLIEHAMFSPFHVKQHAEQYRTSLERIVQLLISE